MSTRSLKHALFAEFAAVAKAIAHAHRLELLELLAQGERSVEALAQKAGLSVANTSQHLQQMRRAGIVSTRRAGKFVYYAVGDDAVLNLLIALRSLAERNSAEVERVVRNYFHDRDSMEPVSRTELLRQLRTGAVTVLDVRPADEFALGHVPHAVNMPLADIERRLSELDPYQQIVAYCRGPYCVLAFEAVALLRSRGFQARRMEDGFPEWRGAGFPLAS